MTVSESGDSRDFRRDSRVRICPFSFVRSKGAPRLFASSPMGDAVSMTRQRDNREIFEYLQAAGSGFVVSEKRADRSFVKRLTVGAGGN